ncbi:MAG: response regulator transcription factor [Clostridia bacterium]|nr:response regulator transcription factor [Clostridia bacterium]
MHKILICDDESDIVNALKIYLNNSEYEFEVASNGVEALNIVRKEDIHLVLLDIMMPVMNGIEALAKIREISDVPVIMLTAKSEDYDIISGLNSGADDYITKPFKPLEVVARVNSQLRRYCSFKNKETAPEIYRNGGIEIDDVAKEVRVDGEMISLTPKEYDILKLLISNPNKVYSPKQIYLQVWKETPMYKSENAVAVHIRHLREKIEIDSENPRYVKAIFGQGYKMERIRN